VTRWLAIAVLVVALLPSECQAQPARAADIPKPAAKPDGAATADKKPAAQPPPAVKSQESGPPQTERKQTPEEINEKLADYTYELALFTKLLVGATLLLAVPALWQGFISWRTARRQLRAYVTNGVIHASSGEPPQAVVVTRNFGQTPAHNVKHRIGLVVADIDKPDLKPLAHTFGSAPGVLSSRKRR
jgi:hypothetical protein